MIYPNADASLLQSTVNGQQGGSFNLKNGTSNIQNGTLNIQNSKLNIQCGRLNIKNAISINSSP